MNTKERPDNIIYLPTRSTAPNLLEIEQSIANIQQRKQEYCDEVSDFAMEHLIHCIKGFGFLADGSRVNGKDLVLVELAIESILYRYYGIEHPLHETVEQLISDGSEDTDEITIPEDA